MQVGQRSATHSCMNVIIIGNNRHLSFSFTETYSVKFVQFKENKEDEIFLFIICFEAFYEKDLFYTSLQVYFYVSNRVPFYCVNNLHK